MGAGTRPLAADEIAIRGRDRALARRYGLAIGGQAHRAAGLPPFEAGIDEKLVEPFGHGIPLDRLRTRYHPGAHARRYLAAARDFGRGTRIAQAAISARPDEDHIDR